MTSLKRLFSGIYKLCECRCGSLIPFINKQRTPARFKRGHYVNTLKFGLNYKGQGPGRRFKHQKYWKLYMPDYFGSDKQGVVLEHRYFFQEFNKCCMLKWGYVHHIDENKENNMSWNLEGMTAKQHNKHHLTKNMSGRICADCGSSKTRMKLGKYPDWYKDGFGGLLCQLCNKRHKDLIKSLIS